MAKEIINGIELMERGGFYEARRAGWPGRVIHRHRDVAIQRARNWRSRHIRKEPEAVCLGYGPLGRARAEAEEARYDVA